MQVQLAFGKTGIKLELPDGFHYRVLEARSAKPVPDEIASVKKALENPIDSPPLRELARGKHSVATAVCDITRPAPNRKTLPVILEELGKAGLPPEAVRILIATGLHREATPEEVREIVGEEIATRYTVLNHNARRRDLHIDLGVTARGTPVLIDRRFVEAELRITVGFIEPHLMAGFSGGRKLVAPGLAGEQTIKHLHSPQFMRDPRAVEGIIEGNPLHEELLEIARLAGQHFIVDVALSRERKIAGVFAGEPESAHLAGVRFIETVMLEELDEPADAVITSAAGYPLDLTFYQSIKGITAASHIVRPGGRILLMAECAEGAGGPEFCQMLAEPGSPEGFLASIEDRPVIVDQWQLEKLALAAKKAQLFFFVPGLPAHYRSKLWGQSFNSPEAAVKAVLDGLAPGSCVAVIPEGPYVLARARAAGVEHYLPT